MTPTTGEADLATITLPALDGRDPLGFLAALGTLRLLTDNRALTARLSFDDITASARLHSPLPTIDTLVTTITGLITTIPNDGAIPNLPATFPLAKTGSEPDPMRTPRNQFRDTATRILATAGTPTDAELSRWLTCLVTDLAIDAQGRAALTPYTAPAGQQSLRTFFTKSLDEVRKDPARLVHEAYTGWRRVDGYTGEYLDHRALRSAADHPTGKSVEAGVPAATWLAIMGLPKLQLTGTGTATNPAAQATLWHTVNRQTVMIWPLWRQALDPHAITALLEHPTLRPTATNPLTVNGRHWPALGIFTVAAATRQPIDGRKSAGVLTPVPVQATS